MAAGILRVAIIIKVRQLPLPNLSQRLLLTTLYPQSPISGAQAAGSWAIRETFVAVVVGNLPMIYPVVSRLLDRFINSSFMSRYLTSGSSSNKPGSYPLNPTIGSDRMRDRGGKRNIKSFNALPTTYHENDSEERIVKVGDTITEEGKSEPSLLGKDGGIVVTRETDVEFRKREPSMGV